MGKERNRHYPERRAMSVARMLLDDGASATKACDAPDAAKSAADKVWPTIRAMLSRGIAKSMKGR